MAFLQGGRISCREATHGMLPELVQDPGELESIFVR